MPIRTLPEPLQNTAIWDTVTPQPPAPPPMPAQPQPSPDTGAGLGAFVGQQAAQSTPPPAPPPDAQTAQEQYMAQQIPDQQVQMPTPEQQQYNQGGTLLGQVRQQRQAEGRTSDDTALAKVGAFAFGLPLAAGAIEAAAPAIDSAAAPLVERGLTMGPSLPLVGTAGQLATTLAGGTALSTAISHARGYEDLPRPLQTAVQTLPYVLNQPSLLRKAAVVGATVLGSEGAQLINKKAGSPAPSWVADMIGQGIGTIATGAVLKEPTTQIAKIMSEGENGAERLLSKNGTEADKAIDDFMGWNQKAHDILEPGAKPRPSVDVTPDDIENMPVGSFKRVPDGLMKGDPSAAMEIERLDKDTYHITFSDGATREGSWADVSERINDGLNPPMRSADAEMRASKNELDMLPTSEVRSRFQDASNGRANISPEERQQQMGELMMKEREYVQRQQAATDSEGYVKDEAAYKVATYGLEGIKQQIRDLQSNGGYAGDAQRDVVRYGEELYRRTNGAEGIKPREGLKFEGGDTSPAPSEYNAGLARPNTLASQVAANRQVSPLADLPSIDRLVAGVDTIANDGALNKIGRTVFGLPNPSVARETPLGKLGTAIQRQNVIINNLTEGHLQTWYDNVARTGIGRDIWRLDRNNFAKVEDATGTKVKVLINKVLENPENYHLTPEQSDFIRTTDSIIQSVEDMRVRNGLSSRQLAREPRAPGEPKYFPRNTTAKGELELGQNSANISRSGKSLDELLNEGFKFNDPRSALDNYIRQAYAEVAHQQQAEYLARYGVKPSELVPEPVRIALEKATAARDKAHAFQRKEAQMTQRMANQGVMSDYEQARKELELAKSNQRALKRFIAGQGTRTDQQALSFGSRLAEANSIVNVAQGIFDDVSSRMAGKGAKLVYNAKLNQLSKDLINYQEALRAAREAEQAANPGMSSVGINMKTSVRKAKLDIANTQAAINEEIKNQGVAFTRHAPDFNAVSPETLKATADADRAYERAHRSYQKEMEKVNASRNAGEPVSAAYWSPEVIQARQEMNDSVKAYQDMKEAKGVPVKRSLDPDVIDQSERNAKVWSDPDIKAKRIEMRIAQKNYQDTLKQAMANDPSEVIAKAMPSDLKLGTSNFAIQRDVDQLQKGLDLAFPKPAEKSPTALVGQAGQQILNTMRTASTGLDFGIGFIHLLPMLYRDPRAWANGVAHNYIDAFNPKNFSNFMQEHSGTVQWLNKHYMGTGSNDLYDALKPGEGLSLGMLDKLPGGEGARRTLQQVGKQTYGRLAHGTEAAQTVAQVLYAEGLMKHWQGSEDDLAQHIRNMTGAIDTKSLGVSRLGRNFEATMLALSPKLLRSSLALMGDLRYLSAINDPAARSRGIAAFRGLGQLAAGAAITYALIGTALGKSQKDITDGLNPANGKRFMSHKINGEWIGFGGVMRGLIQMMYLGGSALAPDGKPIQDLWALNGQRNPLLAFMLSRGAPALNVASQVGEYATGANLDSYHKIDKLPDVANALAKDTLPYTISGYIEGDTLLGAGANTIGLRNSPETAPEVRTDDIEQRIIPDMQARGILPPEVHHLDDLGFGEQQAVLRELKSRYPDHVDAYNQYRNQFNSIFQQKEDKRQQIDDDYNKEFDQILQGLNTGTLDPKTANDQLTNTRNQLRGAYDLLYNKDPAYQKAINGLKANALEKLEDAYEQIPNQVAGDRKNLTSDDWNEVNRKQQIFLSQLNEGDRQRLLNDLQLRNSVQDAHPLIQAKRQVDQASQSYYELPQDGPQRQDYLKANPELNVQRWWLYGTALESTEAVDAVLNHQSPGIIGQFMAAPQFNREVKLSGFEHPINKDLQTWKQDEPTLHKFLTLTPQQRSLAISAIPSMQALSVYWGHSASLDAQSAPTFMQKVSANPPPSWQQDSQLIGLYYQLPETDSKTKLDKQHLRAKSPKLDAAIALFEEAFYGKQPQFRSQAGAAEFYRRTGRNVDQFAVNPPKD